MIQIVVVVVVSLAMVLGGTVARTLAQDCHGRLIVIGASPWEVKERCGEPTAIEDVVKYIPQRILDPTSNAPGYILVPVQQSIWTYNFGSSRLLYYLTFQEGKLIDIKTGDYGG
jgi:hypothetical protein